MKDADNEARKKAWREALQDPFSPESLKRELLFSIMRAGLGGEVYNLETGELVKTISNQVTKQTQRGAAQIN
jgi:hypothetical protein